MPPQAVVSSTFAPEAPSATSTLPQSSAFQSGIVTSATSTAVHVSSTLVSVNVATTSMSSPTGTASVWNLTSTIVTGNSATVVIIEEPAGSLFSLSGNSTAMGKTVIPAGSVFTYLPSSTPGATSESPGGSQLSSWRAFLVAFFVIVFFFLFLRLGVYLLGRRAGQSAVLGSWPRWLQVLCCYRPREDEEDDSLASSTDMRQSYIEGGAEYSEASRAQALALVREASANWRNRFRPQRSGSPSEDDPVPPYPGPPLTPLENPFADPSTAEPAESSEGTVDSKEEAERLPTSGYTRSQ